MEKNKKSIVIGVTSLLLVTLILLGLTYAYYKTRIVGNTNEKSVIVESKNLSVKYQNESAVINAEGIEPEYTATKTFEVTNTGSESVNYSVMLDNVTNTFTRLEDWTYTISENGSELKSGTLPNSDSYILYSESIDAGATKSYTLKIDYAYLEDVDQSDDMGASLSFRINISDSLGTTLTSATEGTLLYAIGRDNVVSEPLTIPGQQASGITPYSEGTLSTETKSYSVSSTYQGYYFVYGTGYTFDEKTGLYTLTGVTTTSDTYASSYSELEGKYVAYPSLYSISASTKESALKKTTSRLTNIYKISATSSEFTYQTLSKSTPNYETEAILATTEDDYGTSYYFRGAVVNNYVNYSGMCWRIVRVQGDGTIKLTLADENGECNASTYSTSNTTSAFVDGRINIAYKSSMEKNVNDFLFEDSDVLELLNTWSTSKNLDTSKLVDAEWCNDTAKTSVDESGNYSYYGAYSRLANVSTASPTLKCNTKGMEGSTGIEANAQKYTGKIALLTADEVAFAGSTEYQSGYNYYLKTNANDCIFYWTLSPYYLNDDYYPSYVWLVGSYGDLTNNYVSYQAGSVRPAIVLASNVTIEGGNGTQTNPYVIS